MLGKKYYLYSKSSIPALLRKHRVNLPPDGFVAAAHVFPMRVNNHVVDDLIDWSNVPDDPMFRLSIPQPEMLQPDYLRKIISEMRQPGVSKVHMRTISELIRERMNPHPAGQKEENVPMLDGMPLSGLQHKYRETVLFFPSEGQYCHAYCTYCFRWAQFTSVGSEQTFKSSEYDMLQEYVKRHPSITDVLLTGGDPMVMPAATMRRYIEPLLGPSGPAHLNTIRIGTKSLAWWPYRFVTDNDATDMLKLFSDVVKSGKHLTIQAHFTLPREVEHPVAQEAIRLIRMTGASIRSQAPLIRNVNDDPGVWSHMWNLQTRLGVVPYYMFVERDTGARDYFSVPLARASDIFNTAYSKLAGTARTVRGPSMSASPGKVCVLGVVDVNGEQCFALKFLQARNPEWTKRVFLAKYDPAATWYDDLRPALGAHRFFFEEEYAQQKLSTEGGSSGQLTDSHWQGFASGLA